MTRQFELKDRKPQIQTQRMKRLSVCDQMLECVCVCVADGRRSHVRRGSCGRCGRPAVAADHRQLAAVQQTQTLALRRTIHQPHQRGTNTRNTH